MLRDFHLYFDTRLGAEKEKGEERKSGERGEKEKVWEEERLVCALENLQKCLNYEKRRFLAMSAAAKYPSPSPSPSLSLSPSPSPSPSSTLFNDESTKEGESTSHIAVSQGERRENVCEERDKIEKREEKENEAERTGEVRGEKECESKEREVGRGSLSVVLVETSFSSNIGTVARLCHNFSGNLSLSLSLSLPAGVSECQCMTAVAWALLIGDSRIFGDLSVSGESVFVMPVSVA